VHEIVMKAAADEVLYSSRACVICGVTEAADLALSHGGRCDGMKYANITIPMINLLPL
jgi:hypothetical protein